MEDQPSAQQNNPPEGSPSEELFQIIDETGEGFGFDLTPEALAKPLAITSASLFGIGMLAGVPFGLALGRTQEGEAKRRAAAARPTLNGVKFAATTFGLGTLLCGAMGVAGFYALRWYYQVDSFTQFGHVMRSTVPERRREMERGLGPVLDSVRRNAGDKLPGPMRALQHRFLESRFGLWIKEQVDISVTVDEDTYSANQDVPPSSDTVSPT